MSEPMLKTQSENHIRILDGVRAVSIILVLSGHLLPLGPKVLQLNAAAAASGMSLFFILSGFLIARALQENNNLLDFLIKRIARIAPLAYLFAAAVFVLFDRDVNALVREMSFTLNDDAGAVNAFNGHLWSLCVEMQFYLVMGLLFRWLRTPVPYVILGLCLTASVLKVVAHDPYSMKTALRGDELLAGSLLYMSINGRFGDHRRFWRVMERCTPLLAVALLATARPGLGGLNYVRAYAAALLVGSVMITRRRWLSQALCSRPMLYMARVSYAVYIIHMGVWAAVTAKLGMGSTIGRMLVQRPLTFAITFPLAHLSTFYYEAPWIDLGRRLTGARRRMKRIGGAPAHQPV